MRLGLALLFLTSTFFNTAYSVPDFTIDNALEQAYKNNPELQAEMDKAQALKGLFIQSGLYPNPQLLFTAENIGGSGIYSGYESAESTLAISQPIPLGNRLYYLKKASFADYLSSLASIEVQKNNLYRSVATTYIDALYAEQWHQVTKKLVSLNKKITSIIRHRMEAGATPELDLKLAEVRLGEAKIQERQALQMAITQRAKLTRLIGRNSLITNPLSDKQFGHHLSAWTSLLKQLNKSPQLLAQLVQVKAKRARIIATKKSVWPDLNLQLGARHFSDDGNNAAVVSVYSQLPVFDKNQGNIQAAEAQLTQALHEYKGMRLEVKQTLYSAFLQAKQSRYESELVANSLLPLARKSIKLAQSGYQKGNFSYLQLTLALNTLYEEERHYQQAHAEYHKALIQIAGLLGTHKQGLE